MAATRLARAKRPPQPNPIFEGMSKSQKDAMRQKLKRKRKREAKLALKHQQAAVSTRSDVDINGGVGATVRSNGTSVGVPLARQISNKLARKLHRLDPEEFAFENAQGLKRYRSPHVPDKTFFSVRARMYGVRFPHQCDSCCLCRSLPSRSNCCIT